MIKLNLAIFGAFSMTAIPVFAAEVCTVTSTWESVYAKCSITCTKKADEALVDPVWRRFGPDGFNQANENTKKMIVAGYDLKAVTTVYDFYIYTFIKP